ncbi:T9SS type A sorting domain-containing protein [Mucilaginibacter sp.]
MLLTGLFKSNKSYGANYTIGGIFDWVGSQSTDITDSRNFRMNGSTVASAPGPNDTVRIGVVPYISPSYQPTIDNNTTFAKMEFGSNNSPVLTITNTDFYFLSNLSYTLTLSQGLVVDANANPVLKSSGLNFIFIIFQLPYATSNIIVGGTSTIASTGSLTLYNPIIVTNTGSFTLNSDANGSATIGYNASGGKSYFAGSYIVQRYMPGGAGYRGYRLLTLPVNVNIDPTITNQAANEGFIDLSSLNSGMLTAGPGTGFSYSTANPLMYLYDESRAQNFTAYIAGKNVGIYAMTGSPTYNVTTYGTTIGAAKTTAQVPVGNSVQVYYVGPNTAPDLSATAPLASTTSATGYLNQGTIPVYIFPGTSSKTLSYSPGVNTLPAQGLGLNQVGNPYASTINLDSLYFDNKTGTTAIGPMFWELKEPNNTLVAYSANHTSSTSSSESYVASGQGFYVQALSTSSALTFYEKDKVNVTIGTSTSPVLILNQSTNSSISAAAALPSGPAGLHLQIMKDTATYTQTGIYFNPDWNDKYSPLEDAIDLDGTAPKVYLSSYSSDGARLCINGLGNYNQGKTVKLYASATTSDTYTISLADIKNIDALYNVYLRDHKLNDSVNLRGTNAYTFTINKGDTSTYGANRFDLVLEREALPPYQLITFTGQKISSGVQLNWVANNTGNYTGFVLEKEGANNNFSPIYTTQSNNSSEYSFVDSNPVIGNNIYRLAQNDINGNVSYSSLITIGYTSVSSNGYFSVYPNPSKDMINILVNSTTTTAANYTADIYNTSGVLMDHRILNTYSWTEGISSYKEGVYIIALKDMNGDVLSKSKFIKTK